MKSVFWIAVVVTLSACADNQPDARQIAEAQAKSWIGPTAQWKLDPALNPSDVQQMRDRAYGYCFGEKPSDKNCLRDQDHSLFEYTNAFRLVRVFRAEPEPANPYALAHKQDRAAFERVHDYCRSVYRDQGSRDARGLGPCMFAGLGGDFFGVVPVR